MTPLEPETTFTVTLKGHPVSAWLLRIAATGYVAIDDEAPVELTWKGTNEFRTATPGVHGIRITLTYFDEVTKTSRTFRPRIEDGDSFTIVKGRSAQHPFTLERNHD